MEDIRQKRWFKITALAVAFCFLLSGLTYYYHSSSASGIYDINVARDSEFIHKIFAQDLYWLTTQSSHDTDYMLTHKASSKNPQHTGNLTIKVAYEGTNPVGFIAYYKKNFYTGYILFIDVINAFRAQGWGKRLLDYGVKDLLTHGCTKIQLVTRTSNTAAQKLYSSYGFKETNRDEEFVNFEYTA
jgi:ribosomal protein S18 acetylase RimI-like enzyme